MSRARRRHLSAIGPWLAIATLLALAGNRAAQADFSEYGIASVSASLSTAGAGDRPDFETVINIKTDPSRPLDAFAHERPYAGTKRVDVDLPPGLVGNPNAIPHCTSLQFATAFTSGGCPQDSQVGVTIVRLYLFPTQLTEPIFNLEAPGGDTVARLGFYAANIPVFINVHVRSGGDYGLTATLEGIPANELLISADTTLWGIPADPSHDTRRLTVREGYPGAKSESPPRESGLSPTPFLSNPGACTGPLQVGFLARSYPLPDLASTAVAALPGMTECEGLGFAPLLTIDPTSRQAVAPTGLEARLHIPQNQSPTGRATSEMRDATVTLPPGTTINPSAADGLAACDDSQAGAGSDRASACPDAAKIGSATFVSPALSEPLHGAIYQRAPASGDLFRIWLIADDLGVHLKIPGDVRPDPNTGQLTTVFTDTPQLPVEEIDLDLKAGSRAPLANPERCGSFASHYVLAPWSGNPASVGDAPLRIDQACSTGGFGPRFSAGSTNPVAGRFSSFVADVSRGDGEQNLAALDVSPPKGELAKLAGVPLCSESRAASGDCPPASRVGSVMVAAGAGSQPLWLPQPGRAPTAVYLAGPYRRAPFSFVVVVPAQAGPFDLGTVVTRAGIEIDPQTAGVTVRSDPLPQILQGVPVRYRHLHVAIDRDGFALNPTNCAPLSAAARLESTAGAQATRASRFQIAGCASLPFRPQLSLRLRGPTRRTAHPKLIVNLRARRGEANIARAQVKLPRAAFLDQGHIGTVCTRVQFAADTCPPNSIYGRARAVTPLLDYPLTGSVYLRSSSHPLPDLVIKLKGPDSQPIEVDLLGRTDSVKGALRNTFEAVPDAPVSSFHLALFGSKRGLIELSSGLCQSPRAAVNLTGQNGRTRDREPKVRTGCGESKLRR